MPDSNATITRLELVKRAYRRCGLDNPSTNRIAQAVAVLNDKLKELDAEGRWLHTITNTESTLTLSSGTRSYSAGTGAANIAQYIVEFERVDLLIGTTYHPLTIIDKTTALSTYDREGTGQPYLVHLEKSALRTSQKAHFFPTPNGTFTVKYTYRRALYDFDNSSDNPDFPGWANQPLVKILAAEIAPECGVSIAEIAQYHEPKAQEAMRQLLKYNSERPDSTRLKTVFF